MKTAVIFYSLSGNTAYIAEILKDRLDADLIRIRPKKEYPDKGLKKFYLGGKDAVRSEEPELEPCGFDPDRYDLIILGTPVWAGTFAPPLRTFLNRERNSLQKKKIAAYCCCSGSGGEKALTRMERFLESDPFMERMVLIDPKEKRSEVNSHTIDDFCANIQKEH